MKGYLHHNDVPRSQRLQRKQSPDAEITVFRIDSQYSNTIFSVVRGEAVKEKEQ
jgi:hypothetical protein